MKHLLFLLVLCAGCEQPIVAVREPAGNEELSTSIFGNYILETSEAFSQVTLQPDSTYSYYYLANCIGDKHDTGTFRMHGDTLLFQSRFQFNADTAVINYSEKIKRIYGDTCLLKDHRIYNTRNAGGYFDPYNYWIEESYYQGDQKNRMMLDQHR